MMNNAERVEQAEGLVNAVRNHYWLAEPIAGRHGFHHEAHGYEHDTPEEERVRLRYRYDDEAFAIRFQPDARVFQISEFQENRNLLIEYKATTTPRYTFHRNQWNRGQIEADPWEHYLQLMREDRTVAILNYCSYHLRPLLCDFPSENWQIGGRQRVKSTQTGSRTDYYNINLRLMRSFDQFMLDEFGVPQETSLPLIRAALAVIRRIPLLQTRHHDNSTHHLDPNFLTSFNWEAQYLPR